jgi:hypothetical protein
MTSAIFSVMRKIEELINRRSTVQNAASLSALKKEMVQLTDELASAIMALKVQEQLQAQAHALTKTYPQRLKNKGSREVEIRGFTRPETSGQNQICKKER